MSIKKLNGNKNNDRLGRDSKEDYLLTLGKEHLITVLPRMATTKPFQNWYLAQMKIKPGITPQEKKPYILFPPFFPIIATLRFTEGKLIVSSICFNTTCSQGKAENELTEGSMTNTET